MERILQYLDDLEDAVFAVALMSEVIRRIARAVIGTGLLIAVAAFALIASTGHTVGSLVFLNTLLLVALYRSMLRDRMLSIVPDA